MDFGEILSRAWKIIWKHKILWLFGILAGCGQGSGGGSGGGNSGYEFSSGDPNLPPEMKRFFFNMERFFAQVEAWEIIGWIAIAVLAILALWFIMLALSTIGRIGLIQGTLQADSETTERFAFGELFNQGKPFFWRLLGLNLLIGLAGFVLVLIFVVPLVAIGALTAGVAFLCFIPLLCVLVPLGWVISIIIQQANIILVVEDVGIFESLQRGWNFFRAQWGNLLIMGIILGIGGAVIGFILALPIIFVVFPAVLALIIGSANGSGSTMGTTLGVAGLCMLGYAPVLVVLSGILQAYIHSAWTLTYQRLVVPVPVADETDGQDLDAK